MSDLAEAVKPDHSGRTSASEKLFEELVKCNDCLGYHVYKDVRNGTYLIYIPGYHTPIRAFFCEETSNIIVRSENGSKQKTVPLRYNRVTQRFEGRTEQFCDPVTGQIKKTYGSPMVLIFEVIQEILTPKKT